MTLKDAIKAKVRDCVGTGYLFSIGSAFFYKSQQFYEASAVLLVFILLGHWVEMKARAGASAAIRALLDLAPPKATILRNGQEVEIPTAEVIVGDIVTLRPGNKIPADGEVIEGESTVDESMLTGESMPVTKKQSDSVIGATINKSGTLRYRATKVGADTALAQIVKLVQEAQNSKAPAQLLADRASQVLVLAAIVIGPATFAAWYWWIGQPLLFAPTLTITVFVVACPDALGLATPMAVMVGTGLQAQNLKVGMVGDGVNDAPALTQADVGFAIGAGTDVAIESADVVLMKSDPYDVVAAVELSRATLRKMRQNLWWAMGYNLIAFPLAAGVFYPFLLSPEIAALAMSGSSALVAINALMLKRTRLAGITHRDGQASSAVGVPA